MSPCPSEMTPCPSEITGDIEDHAMSFSTKTTSLST